MEKTEEKNQIVIDAENAILGRLASFSAKQALLGKKVIIVNSEKAVVSGNRKSIIQGYLEKRKFKKVKYPSMPEQILKRTIRGMLSYKMGRGEEAFKRIRCYKGVPKEFENEKKIKSGRENKDLMSLEELSKMLK
ncbi:50S ribosomal protein L13 [Candidatus Pacearchaeota archaeon]|nr:50S ribosomal protein L13 [Candidatus Pacearchaeota archaeon]